MAVIDSHTILDQTLYTDEYNPGQSFMTGNSYYYVDNVQLRLTTVSGDSGNLYVKIYNHTGTYGTSSVPIGEPLATSQAVNTSYIDANGGSGVLCTFQFIGENRPLLGNNAPYTFVLDTSEMVTSDTNAIQIGYANCAGAEATHAGNQFLVSHGTSQYSPLSHDMYFLVNGTATDITRDPETAPHSPIADYNGTEFQRSKTKIWDGSQWVYSKPRMYTGTEWRDLL